MQNEIERRDRLQRCAATQLQVAAEWIRNGGAAAVRYDLIEAKYHAELAVRLIDKALAADRAADETAFQQDNDFDLSDDDRHDVGYNTLADECPDA